MAQDIDGLRGADRDLTARASLPAASARPRLLLLCGILAAAGGLTALLKLAQLHGLPLDIGVLTIEGLGAIGIVMILQATALTASAAGFGMTSRARLRAAAWLCIGGGMAGSILVVWVLRAFPNSGDEYDYLFQAQTFLAGRLWNPVPPQPEFFAFFWQVFADGKWITIYPPGWSGLLAAAMVLRLPSWLASPLAGGVLLFALFKLGERRSGLPSGVLALALVAVSPFFLFNAASYFMHVPVAAAGLLFCWAAVDFLDAPRSFKAWLAGIALGVLGMIRPEDVPLFALPFCCEFLWRAQRQHYRCASAIIFGGLPFLAALLLYYHATMGSALPDLARYYPSLKIGLYSIDQFGHPFTPFDQLCMAATRMVMLGQWTSPLLVFGYLAAFAWIAAQRRLHFLDFIFPLFVIGYLLWPAFGGNQYGPRYYFDAFPLLALTVSSAVAPMLQDAAQPRRAIFAAALVMAHIVICIAGAVGQGILFRTVVDQRMDLYDEVKAKRLQDAVVVIRSPTGLIRPMEPMDLTRNGIALDGKVIYALDIPHRLDDLRRLFPHRRFYVYERKSDSPTGTLRPLG